MRICLTTLGVSCLERYDEAKQIVVADVGKLRRLSFILRNISKYAE